MGKKNCFNCKHLSSDSDCDTDGHNCFDYYICEKRDCADDIKLQQNLERKEYLNKGKVCCDLKDITAA